MKITTRRHHGPRMLSIAMLIGIIGCASAPHPAQGLREGRYVNDVYQYSVAIPLGWRAYDKVPDDVARLLGEALTDATQLVLVAQTGDGIIAVINLPDETGFDEYVNIPDSAWERMPLALGEQMGRQGEVIRFDHELVPENLERTRRNRYATPPTFKPQALLTAEFDMRYAAGNSTSGIKWYLYPCQGHDTCQAIIMLTCNQDQYGDNRPVLDAMAASLTIHTAADD